MRESIVNADYQWMDENYRARPENGENERDMKDIDFILDEYRIHISFIVENSSYQIYSII